MRDFKIRKIDYDKSPDSFQVEIEFDDNGDRQRFGFAKTDNWELMIDGEPKFIRNIRDRVAEREAKRTTENADKLKDIKSNFEGYSVKLSDAIKKKVPKVFGKEAAQ